MPEPDVHQRVADVLDAVSDRPDELPARELAALQGCGVDVDIARTAAETIVFVEPRADERLASLTPREREVITLAAGGMSNQQIATALFSSRRPGRAMPVAMMAVSPFPSTVRTPGRRRHPSKVGCGR